MPFKSEKQRKWMWANDPEMAEKWENEEKSESRKMRVTESNLRSIIRRTLLAEQSVSGAIKMLMDTLDDNQKAELASAMGDPSKPSGTSGTSAPEETNDDEDTLPTGDISPEVLGSILDDPENQDAAATAISSDPAALQGIMGDNPEAIEAVVEKNPSMLQGFLEDPGIMGKLEDMLSGSDFLKGILAKAQGSGAADAVGELGENKMKITKRQLKTIVRNSLLESSRAGEAENAGYDDGSDGLEPKYLDDMDYMAGWETGNEDYEHDIDRAKEGATASRSAVSKYSSRTDGLPRERR